MLIINLPANGELDDDVFLQLSANRTYQVILTVPYCNVLENVLMNKSYVSFNDSFLTRQIV